MGKNKNLRSFEDALGDLLAEYSDADPNELISGLEIQLMGLRDQQENE